jgi:hypothetical protein
MIKSSFGENLKPLPGTRIYELRYGWGSESNIMRWGASRFGKGHDDEMQAEVFKDTSPGNGMYFYVVFVPETPRLKTPEQVQAQRIANMRRRAAREPLFADQIEAAELQREYYSLEAARAAQARRRQCYEKWSKRFYDEHRPELEISLPGS